MKKIVDLLEKQVEWIVLGLSLLFVAYSAYAYLLQPPITVALDGGPARYPGEIDKETREGPVQDLEARMTAATSVNVPTPPSYAAHFKDAMTYASEPAKPLAAAMLVLPKTPKVIIAVPDSSTITNSPDAPGNNVVATRIPGGGTGTVLELPKIPPVKIDESRQGSSFVVPGPPPSPGTPIDMTGGADKGWVTLRFEIEVPALAAAWDEQKIPERNANTTVLEVNMERQERQSDGSWGPSLPVGPVQVNPMESLPPVGSDAKRNLDYAKWASTHQRDILQPMFYTVAKGDPWAPPGIQLAESRQTTEKFDPSRYINAKPSELLPLTPEQRRLVYQAQQKNKKPAARGPVRRGPAPRGGNAIPGEASPAPLDPDRPNNFQARGNPANEDVDHPAPVETPPPGATPTAAAPVAQALSYKPDDFPLPSAEFDPHKWLADHPTKPTLIGWAHDDSVQPGKAYKYRITYKVKNPMYLANNIVRDPKLAEPFSLESVPSDWSDVIEINSAINFWVARARPSTSTAAIDIFRRQGGELKHKVFDLGPGDAIGGKDGEIDYATDWTLVDVLVDPRSQDVYVLLMDKFGGLHRRDVKTDSTSPEFLHAKAQAAGISMAH